DYDDLPQGHFYDPDAEYEPDPEYPAPAVLDDGRPATPRTCMVALSQFRSQISIVTTLSGHLPARRGPLVAVC
ncbi:hypothetical protein ACWCPC_38740, partial [Streptomyces decoyicus]